MSSFKKDPASLHRDPLLRDVPVRDGCKFLDPVFLYGKVGHGGMGTVYWGRHPDLGIDVAVKCLKPEFAALHQHSVPRFQREAHLAAKLSHQNLVRIFELKSKHGISYSVLELVDGEDARKRVERKGPLEESEAAKLMLGVSRGLSTAHRRQEVIVHRDIKPENILISTRGEVKLADLGLAKAVRRASIASFETDGVVGTPRYMAPEQWDASVTPTPKTDVWAMGATLFFLLSGQHAMQGETTEQVYAEIKNCKFIDVGRARHDLSNQMIALVAKCTQLDPSRRYIDAADLARDLQQIVKDHRTPTKRRRTIRGAKVNLRWALVAASFGALGLIAAWGTRSSIRVPTGWRAEGGAKGTSGWARTIRHPDTGIVMRLIEPGAFIMGSQPNEPGRDPDETPHYVEISRPYYMAEQLTTRAQYHIAGDENFEGGELPIGNLTWREAFKFCKDLRVQLPTEAQWEFAARSGAATSYWWGDDHSDEFAASPNRYGIRDVSSGLWEWCFDGYEAEYGNAAARDPVHSPIGLSGVLRGGQDARLADRRPEPLSARSPEFGFRVALVPE